MKRSHERFDVSAARWGALCIAAVLMGSGCSASAGGIDTEAAGVGSSPSAGTDSAPAEIITSSAAPTPTASAYKPATAESPAENVPLPVMPEIAEEQSKEGLEAFGDHWFDLVNYGYETGDTLPVKEISAPGCERCASFYVDVDEGYANDDWIQGGQLRVISRVSEFVETPEGRFQLILSIRQDGSFNRGPDSKLYDKQKADTESTAFIMEATYVLDRWVVDLVEAI